MKKEVFWTKFMKRFYGITGELDEYRRQEINRINSQAFMILFYYTVVANFIFLIVLLKFPNIAGWLLLGANVIVFFLTNIYILRQIKRSHIAQEYVANKDYQTTYRTLVKSSIKSGVLFAILFDICSTLINYIDQSHLNFLHHLFSPASLIQYSLSGLFFGFMMFLIGKNRLKIDD